MTTFVLIHGAWHYGALWGEVAQPLRESGHAVHAPTLAGNGPGDDIDRTVGHRDAVASAVDYVLREDLTDFVLLGHSYGGTIISRMAEEMPERIRRLVYWNAFVLNDGESIESVSPPHYKQLMDSIAASGAHGPGAVKLPFPVWREVFMNDADLALAEKTYELTTPHPLKTLTDPVELESFHELQTPRSYLNCTEDIAMPPGNTPGARVFRRASAFAGWCRCRAGTKRVSPTRRCWPRRSSKRAGTERSSFPLQHRGSWTVQGHEPELRFPRGLRAAPGASDSAEVSRPAVRVGQRPSSATRRLSRSPGARAGSPRPHPHSVAMPKSETVFAAAAMRRRSPSRSSWWMTPRWRSQPAGGLGAASGA